MGRDAGGDDAAIGGVAVGGAVGFDLIADLDVRDRVVVLDAGAVWQPGARHDHGADAAQCEFDFGWGVVAQADLELGRIARAEPLRLRFRIGVGDDDLFGILDVEEVGAGSEFFGRDGSAE